MAPFHQFHRNSCEPEFVLWGGGDFGNFTMVSGEKSKESIRLRSDENSMKTFHNSFQLISRMRLCKNVSMTGL